jgi:hypothetical protein
MDITTRRVALDLLVIGIVLRVSERLPLVATRTLGLSTARWAAAGLASPQVAAAASAVAHRLSPAQIANRARTPA